MRCDSNSPSVSRHFVRRFSQKILIEKYTMEVKYSMSAFYRQIFNTIWERGVIHLSLPALHDDKILITSYKCHTKC